MNAREAIERLSPFLECSNKQIVEAYKTAITALEKQVPRKPEEVKSALDYDTFGCPSCKFSVGWTDGLNGMFNNFCTNCGQYISWEVKS